MTPTTQTKKRATRTTKASTASQKRGRGRPEGSKNRPKHIVLKERAEKAERAAERAQQAADRLQRTIERVNRLAAPPTQYVRAPVATEPEVVPVRSAPTVSGHSILRMKISHDGMATPQVSVGNDLEFRNIPINDWMRLARQGRPVSFIFASNEHVAETQAMRLDLMTI